MNRRICQISSSAMLNEAIDRMRALDADVLPVVENHQIVGVIAAGRIAQAPSGDEDLRTTPVRNAMTRDVACCSQDDDIEKAIDLMETNQARRLIVLDSRGAAVGVLSAEDLTAKVGEHPREGPPMEGENHESPDY